MHKAIVAIRMKIMCHSENNMTNWPRLGATTGMTMKTMKTSDITSAIALPPNTSRIIDMVITRVAAAPRPWTNLSTRRVSKVGAKPDANAART